jgi:hypothetical protein
VPRDLQDGTDVRLRIVDHEPRPASFDTQAGSYDRRVGWPEQTCQAIVRAALTMAQTQPGDGILDELCRWAIVTFGDLYQEVMSEEAYVLHGVRLRPRV